ncbi:hypothetical protein ACFWW0_21550, partial [Streptomyces violascens]
MTRMRHRLRCTFAAAVAAAAAFGGMAGGATTAQAAAAPSVQSTPLSPELEKIRAAEATQLYGSPAERPMADRRSGVLSVCRMIVFREGVASVLGRCHSA